MNPTILAVCDEYIVIDKPAVMHSIRRAESGPSVADYVVSRFPECSEASPKDEDGGLVNRLDFDTSGLLFAARSREGWQRLHSLFVGGGAEKRYHLLVEGRLERRTEVTAFIGTPNRGAKKVRAYAERPRKRERALPAKSVFTPIFWHAPREVTAVEAVTGSGRRHQIRVHAAFLGHPLIGDALYGAVRQLDWGERAFFLHAGRVSLYLPDGLKTYRSSLPKEYLTLEREGERIEGAERAS